MPTLCADFTIGLLHLPIPSHWLNVANLFWLPHIVASLCSWQTQATQMSICANEIFSKLTSNVPLHVSQLWETQIQHAESSHLTTPALMNILGAHDPSLD